MSIIFGILAHRFGSKFFSKWADGSAQALKNVNDTVDGIDSTLELYDNFDRKMIELKLIDEDRVGTKKSSSVWDNLQFISVVFSGILIVILFYSILFDVPFWRN